MKANQAKVGEKVCIKDYKSLTFKIVEIDKRKKRSVVLEHPMTGHTMNFSWGELEKSIL